jgi:hypothetical protein
MTLELLTELAERERSANQNRSMSLLTWATSIGLMGIASYLPPSQAEARAALFGGAAVLTFASKATADTLKTHDRVIEDYRDISDAARQQHLYEALKPRAMPVAIAQPAEELGPAPLPVHNAPLAIASKLKSTVVLGAPRAGKGYALAKALSLLPSNVDIWLIDPKNDPGETHYWTRVPRSQRARFDVTELDQDSVTEIVWDLFERYLAAPSSAARPKLLIVDECAPGLASGMIKKSFSQFMGKLSTICSVGPSKGKFVWVMSQAATVGDLGMSNANKASFRLVAVGHAENTEQSWFRSLNSSLGIAKPATGLTGYIQLIDNVWGYAAPFELPPVTEPADAPRVPAMAAGFSQAPTLTLDVDADLLPRWPAATKEAYALLKRYQGQVRSLRQMCCSNFAQRLGCASTDAMRDAIAPLIDGGYVAITDNGYMWVR